MDEQPRERFAAAQDALIERYDLAAESVSLEVDRPVETVHALVAGDGDPVLMLHGVGATASMYVPLMAELADDFAIHAIDRPGRGLSDPYIHRTGDVREFNRRLLDGVFDALDLESAALIGSSFGGFQSFTYAADRPDRVSKLALLGSPAGLSRELALPYRLFGVTGINRVMFKLVANETVEETRASFEPIIVLDASAVSDELLACSLYASQMEQQRRSLRSLFETTAGIRGVSPEMYVREEVPYLEQPTLFAWGDGDYFYEPTVGRPVAEAMSDAEFVELADHGHVPWLEPENDVGELVRSFL